MFLLPLALHAPALAAPPEPVEDDPVTAPEGRPIRYKERTLLDFTEGLDLQGQVVRPEVIAVNEGQRPGFNPLIHLRTEWDQELKASVDDVK